MPLFNDNCGLLLDVNQNDICIGDLLIKSNKKGQTLKTDVTNYEKDQEI